MLSTKLQHLIQKQEEITKKFSLTTLIVIFPDCILKVVYALSYNSSFKILQFHFLFVILLFET